MAAPFQIARTQGLNRWGIPFGRVLKGLTLRCSNSKEHHYSFIQASWLSPFKISLSNHLSLRIGIKTQKVVATDEQMLRMLLQNRFDLVPFGEIVGKELIKLHGWQNEIGLVSKPLYSANYYMGFSKRGKHLKLIERINQIVAYMRQQGVLDLILHPQN